MLIPSMTAVYIGIIIRRACSLHELLTLCGNCSDCLHYNIIGHFPGDDIISVLKISHVTLVPCDKNLKA